MRKLMIKVTGGHCVSEKNQPCYSAVRFIEWLAQGFPHELLKWMEPNWLRMVLQLLAPVVTAQVLPSAIHDRLPRQYNPRFQLCWPGHLSEGRLDACA
ncbi:MAG: hypothetical protein E3K36_14660 [Candidatus Brocadia sp.]|nr:hypothetical protein [Candidatus Brocadia sp.]